jgi:hypothetical protein
MGVRTYYYGEGSYWLDSESMSQPVPEDHPLFR